MIPLISSFWNGTDNSQAALNSVNFSSQRLFDAIALSSPNNVRCGFKSLDTAALTLRMCRSLRVDERMDENVKIDLFFQELKALQQNLSSLTISPDTKVLVIEGLSGCGKTTICNELIKIPGVSAFGALPPFIHDVYDIFYSMPEPIARAFEYTINYFTVREISSKKPKIAVVDSFYHTTCSYPIISQFCTLEEIDNLPVSAFDWPLDLPKPNLVVYLLTSTDIRLGRRRKVDHAVNTSERYSERIVAKDARVQRAFELVVGPTTVAVDACGSVEEVLALCVEACDVYNLPLYPPSAIDEDIPVTIVQKENVYPSNNIKNKHNRRVSMGIYGSLSDLNW